MSHVAEALAGYDRFAAGAGAAAQRYVLLDVFTRTPLQGNPLAVFRDSGGLSGADMQALARELNLSESVFVLAPVDGGDARVRIFTPAAELPFAGHPVLGTAVLIGIALGAGGAGGARNGADVVLETGAGPVRVALSEGTAAEGFGCMAQPLPRVQAFAPAAELLRALGVERSQLPVEQYVNGPCHVYVALAGEDELAALAPDMGALAALGEVGVTCFVLAEADGAPAHARSRVFAPGLGVPEDPATGSAAGPLAVHIARHGLLAWGEELEILQGVEIGRRSTLLARAVGSAQGGAERVEVSGWAVVVGAGELRP
jgi:trans-2,3-dihydro-3-hydroxyanthranilate isomerase